MNSTSVVTGEKEKSILLLVEIPHNKDDAWFVLQNTPETRSKIFRPFNDTPHQFEYRKHLRGNNGANYPYQGVTCALVDSSLYVIGGGNGNADHYSSSKHNGIETLDISNPSHGWKDNTLPFNCRNTHTAVYGDLIYIFPDKSAPFSEPDLKHYEDKSGRRGYVWDTKKRCSYTISKIPSPTPSKEGYHTIRFCAPLDEKGVIVNVAQDENFYLHDPIMNKWSLCRGYDPLPKERGIRDKDRYIGPSDASYAISSGKLWLLDVGYMFEAMLHIYDLINGKLLLSVSLTEFNDLSCESYCDRNVHLVPLDDDIVCFLWYNSSLTSHHGTRPLTHYLKVWYSVDPAPAIHIVDRMGFCMNDSYYEIISCLPIHLCSEEDLREMKIPPMEEVSVNILRNDDGEVSLEILKNEGLSVANFRVFRWTTEIERDDYDFTQPDPYY